MGVKDISDHSFRTFAKSSEKRLFPLIGKRTYAYPVVRNISFSEILRAY